MAQMFIGDAQLFEPDTILPSQFFAAVRKKVPQEAEYRLAVAVLEDAIDCYQKHLNAADPKVRQLFEDAEAWVASDDRVWPFSFVNICELLNINPAYVRRGLEAWKKRALGARAGAKVVTLKPKPSVREGDRRHIAAKAS